MQLTARQKKVRKLFDELLKSKPERFPKPGGRLKAPDRQGVYIIYSPRHHPVHVGASVRGSRGIRQRLKNHLNAASSFVSKFLKRKSSRLRSGYYFRSLAVSDPRIRAYLENYASGFLCPAHIGLGQVVAKKKKKA